MKTLYLSGAITYNPNHKQDFERAYKDLTEAGYTVISPLHICDDGWDWVTCMRQCIKALVLGSDAVAVIPSDYISVGKELELHIAQCLDMPVKTVTEWAEQESDKEIINYGI